jgi:hypothetical protein
MAAGMPGMMPGMMAGMMPGAIPGAMPGMMGMGGTSPAFPFCATTLMDLFLVHMWPHIALCLTPRMLLSLVQAAWAWAAA